MTMAPVFERKLARMIRGVMRAGAAFSLVRLGDGEARLLDWKPGEPRDLVNQSLVRWGIDPAISDDQLALIQWDVRMAFEMADMVGAPDADHQAQSPEWKRAAEIAHDFNPPHLVDANIHFHMADAGLYGELLRDLDWVGLVTSRDVADRLADAYSIEDYTWWELPQEFRGSQAGHYPERFNELKESLSVPFPGALFLVGGGALGKVYCEWIREQGGVALDVGSMFDAWAGVPTRGYMQGKRRDYMLPLDTAPLTPVSIVIPHGSNTQMLAQCLNSIHDNTRVPHEVIVCDNAYAKRGHESLDLHGNERVIEFEENAGFTRAVNAGIRQSIGNTVMLLNDDTVVPPGWLRGMLEVLAIDHTVGAVGPLSSAPSQWQWTHNMAFQTGQNLPADTYMTANLPGNLAFWCTLIRRDVLDDVGLLDEQFFIYAEDDDWIIRARKKGYKQALDLSTEVYHIHRATYTEEVRQIHLESIAKLRAKHNMVPPPRVLVSVLTEGVVRWELAQSLLKMAHNRNDRRDMYLEIEFSQHKPIANNRNIIVKGFLERDFTHLLMIDSDQVPIANDPLELVHLDLDVVGLPTPLYNARRRPDHPVLWNVAIDSQTDPTKWDIIALGDWGVAEVDAVGTGIMLIARRVLEHPAMRGPFLNEYDEDGIRSRGLDFLFCRRAKEAGFGVYVHTDYVSEHFWELPMLSVWTVRQTAHDESAPRAGTKPVIMLNGREKTAVADLQNVAPPQLQEA